MQYKKFRWLAGTACAMCAQIAATQSQTPYVPASTQQVLLVVPAADDPRVQALRALRQQAQAEPADLELAGEYALAAMELAEATADPRYSGYAQAALANWWEVPAPPPVVRLLRARLALGRHQHELARIDLDALLTQQPQHAQARLARAQVHTIAGRYGEALLDCNAVAEQLDALQQAVCRAIPLSLSGRAVAARQQLQTALQEASVHQLATTHDDALDKSRQRLLQREALYRHAGIAARLDDLQRADDLYQQALTVPARDPDYHLLLEYADFLLEQQRPREVLGLLDNHRRVDDALLRTAIAQTRVLASGQGDQKMRTALADNRAELEAVYAAARRRNDTTHRREEGLFELHVQQRPERALWLARQVWRNQREPIDAQLLLDAALAAAQSAAAQPVRQWLRENNIEAAGLKQRLQALDTTGSSP